MSSGCCVPARRDRSSSPMPVRIGPIFAIASIPTSGSDPCAARPCVSISAQAKPLCAIVSSRPVGSVITQASARYWRTIACVPMLAYSSSVTAVRITSPRIGSSPRSATASIIAARLAFMSNAPRPKSWLPSTLGSRASVIPPRLTVSMCALSISERPEPVPRRMPITFGRPGAVSWSVTSSPAPRIQSATKAAISPSPEPVGSRLGLTDSMRTSSLISLANSLNVKCLRAPVPFEDSLVT